MQQVFRGQGSSSYSWLQQLKIKYESILRKIEKNVHSNIRNQFHGKMFRKT